MISISVTMKRKSTPPEKGYKIRCPRLGHQMHFLYCRFENQGLPCFKTLDCWYEHFLVEEFLSLELAPEIWEEVFNRPLKPKMLSLVELIEQAKKGKRSEE